MATKISVDCSTGEAHEVEMTGDELAAHEEQRATREIRYVGQQLVDARIRSTGATPIEIFRLPLAEQSVYQSTLTIIGIDSGNFATKAMEGRFVHKRLAGNALQVGAITVLSDIHDTAAASWAPNALPQGTDVVFTVVGAAGRTIDWQMAGQILRYAPAGQQDD